MVTIECFFGDSLYYADRFACNFPFSQSDNRRNCIKIIPYRKNTCQNQKFKLKTNAYNFCEVPVILWIVQYT